MDLVRKITTKRAKKTAEKSDDFVFEPGPHKRPHKSLPHGVSAKFSDIYENPLPPKPQKQTQHGIYELPPDIKPPSMTQSPFYSPDVTPTNTFSNSSNKNENNNQVKYRPAPPPRNIGHRRSHSNGMLRLPPLLLPLNGDNNPIFKSNTIASPTPRNTPMGNLDILSPCRSTENLVPITPGYAENPLAFHLRMDKSHSLQADRKVNPNDVSENDLERFLYGNAAMNLKDSDSAMKSASKLDIGNESLTDWEEMKKSLKEDHEMITRRCSRRRSNKEFNYIGGLDPNEHFFFKRSASRKEAEEFLRGCPEGSFVVRLSKQDGALALSVMTNKLGAQHLLITCQSARWMLTGEKSVLREFISVPELIEFYKHNPLPVKGMTPFLLK